MSVIVNLKLESKLKMRIADEKQRYGIGIIVEYLCG